MKVVLPLLALPGVAAIGYRAGTGDWFPLAVVLILTVGVLVALWVPEIYPRWVAWKVQKDVEARRVS